MSYLVAGLGQIHWNISSGGRWEAAKEEGEEAGLHGRQIPPTCIEVESINSKSTSQSVATDSETSL